MSKLRADRRRRKDVAEYRRPRQADPIEDNELSRALESSHQEQKKYF